MTLSKMIAISVAALHNATQAEKAERFAKQRLRHDITPYNRQ